MTTVKNKQFTEFVEKELTTRVMLLSKNISKNKACQLAKEIVQVIDWDNSALMHKGLSWIAKNYLLQKGILV